MKAMQGPTHSPPSAQQNSDKHEPQGVDRSKLGQSPPEAVLTEELVVVELLVEAGELVTIGELGPTPYVLTADS